MFWFWIPEDGGLLLGPLPTAIPDQLVFHENFGYNIQYRITNITALHLEQLFHMEVRQHLETAYNRFLTYLPPTKHHDFNISLR